jgi:predicted acylesterase/phospholipase RssA
MGADIVIAVDVSRLGAVAARATPAAGTQGPASAWSRTSRRALLEAELTLATVVVRPALERTAMLDFDRKLQHLTAGEDATRQVLPALNRAIAEVRKPVELSSKQ